METDLSKSGDAQPAFPVAGGSDVSRLFCTQCGNGPLFSWQARGGRCPACNEQQVIILARSDVESAVRAWVCATKPKLAEGFVIEVNGCTTAQAVAYRPNDQAQTPGVERK